MISAAGRRPAVVVLGDIAVDILAPMLAFPRPGEDHSAPRLGVNCGGVGANVAIALAQWQVGVRLLGCVGRDCFGEFVLRFAEEHAVDVSGVQRCDHAPTAIFFIVVTPDGQRTCFGSRGANAELTRAVLAAQNLQGAHATYLVGYTFLTTPAAEAAEQVLDITRANGARIALDVGMAASTYVPQKILQLSRKVDILFVGEDEAATLTGKHERNDAFFALKRAGFREVVMKLGKHGCLLSEGSGFEEVPAVPVTTMDSTGAGDAFDAAFLQARLRGWRTDEAALIANAAGALVASTMGAGAEMGGAERVADLLRATRLPPRWESVRLRVLERLNLEFASGNFGQSSGGRNEATAGMEAGDGSSPAEITG